MALRVNPILASFCFGLGLYASGAHWVWISIHEIARTPFWISAILWSAFILGLAGLMGAKGWLWTRLAKRSVWLAFPALVLISEFVRSYFLTGFPWLFSGYAWLDTPWQSLAPWVGVYGLSALSALIAVALYRKSPWLIALLALAFIPAPVTEPAQSATFTLVQPNIPADKKWARDWRDTIIERHLNPAIQSETDLLIFSEAALPLLDQQGDEFFARLSQALPDTALISGRLIRGPQDRLPRYYNALAGFGQASGADYKQRLVPFGEYMPLEQWLRGLIDFFDLPLSTLITGTSPEPLRIGDWKPGSLICYEVAYPGLAWSVGRDADLLISVSNDAWFGASIARDQHLQMARMRALELGRPMLRATNDGITAHIGADGHVLAQLDNFETSQLQGQVTARSGRTPYGWVGPWPWLLFCLVVGLSTVPIARRES